MNIELGVDAQCQEMPLADSADFGVPGRATLRWQALVGECGAQPAMDQLQPINITRLTIAQPTSLPLIESFFPNRNPVDCRRRPWTGKPSVNPESGEWMTDEWGGNLRVLYIGGAGSASGTRARPGRRCR